MEIRLIKPDPAFEPSYRAYIEELGDEERYPFPMDFDHEDFPALLKRLEDNAAGRRLPDGFVASTTYWLVSGDELLGASNLRHELPDSLRDYGGHIGLGIRPSQRGKGLGIELMARTIREARRRGIDAVHIHCYKGNEASARMIRACGGRLASEAPAPDGAEVLQRYIVDPA
ncbi:MAG: GNAT family N-acetyltransferase [Pseudomonadota bacterium]